MKDAGSLDLRSTGARIGAVLVVLGVVSAAVVGAKWQLGDMLAANTVAGEEQASLRSDAALTLAPADARAIALASEVATDPGAAVDLAQNAVRAAPRDHRWRLTHARALAGAGRSGEAEAEFRRAVDLAPEYAVCRWYFGNFLLREGRRDEALDQLRRAADGDAKYRPQVLALVWDYTHDVQTLSSVAGSGADNVSYLSYFLAAHGEPAAAVTSWAGLSDGAKQERAEDARSIARLLFEKHRISASLSFSQQSGEAADSRVGAVTNGSFESPIDSSSMPSFGWRISRGDPKTDVATDEKVSHDGKRSLRITFRGTARPEVFTAPQTIAVIGGARYRLTFWLRTENLKAAAPPVIDVATADESKSLGRTPPLPNGTNEWRQMMVEFAVPADVDGVELRTLRSGCSGDECLINGVVWYDDFVLTQL